MNEKLDIDVKTLRPFTKFIYTIGELPTSYLISMTYEEQLIWLCNYLTNTVIPTINNNAEAVKEVQDLVTQLQNYINNYFTNLDVQQEINNKLDEMTQNGTLTTLISNYVQPLIDEQNENITNFKDNVNSTIDNFDRRLTSVASGSPQAVSSISDMTDTSKNYVLTSDGYWYYYNGTSWVQGGLYQSTQVADNTITYNKLDSELKEDLKPSTNILSNKWVGGKYIDTNGVEQTVNSTSYIEIPVTPFDKYKIDIIYLTSVLGTQNVVYMFKNNDSIISFKKGNEVTIDENNRVKEVVEVPYNANKLIVNAYVEYTNFRVNTSNILKIEKYVVNNIEKDQLSEKLQSIFNDQYETVTPTLYVNNAYISTNDVVAYSGYNVYSYDVQPGEKYKITSKQLYNNPILYFGNPNAEMTRTLNDNPYTFQSIDEFIHGESGEQFTDYEFTIPPYCNKIYMSATSLSTLTLKKSTNYKVNAENVDLQDIENKINILKDKTILFVGDSICAASTEGVKGWATLIKENNPNAIIYNYGQDGATIADNGENGNNVLTKIQTMHSEHPLADYIIIQGGINDYWSSDIELGTFNEYSNFNGETPYDISTFSGALEWIFNYCLNNFGGKKVAFIVTQKINSGSNNFYQYMNRAKEICKKWSIPYLDLFEEGDLNYFVSYQKQNYSLTNVVTTGDGCHPNLAGYQIITPKIENWLKYKI